MKNIVKSMNATMRTHSTPYVIWSDSGPPYNKNDWTKFVTSWGATPTKTTIYRNLKKVIHAAYAERKDPEEEVQKYITAYRNTPHSTTSRNPANCCLVETWRQNCQDRSSHHKEARRSEMLAKQKTFKLGDKHDKVPVGPRSIPNHQGKG